MMKSEINIDVRTTVLKIALETEDNVNNLILISSFIIDPEQKAFFKKSKNFSLKNKIDLLLGLKRINKEEHGQFLLLMEFRNKFLHDIDCNSFTYAVDALGKAHGKRLLRFDPGGSTKEEDRYIASYHALFYHTINLLLQKSKEKRESVEKIAGCLKDGYLKSAALIDLHFDFYNAILNYFERRLLANPSRVGEIGPLAKFISQKNKSILDAMDRLNAGDDHKLTEELVIRMFQ